MGKKENIKICVRVRPFASHEEGQDCIVSMSGNSVTLTNPNDGSTKDYKYNRCYWSHDSAEGRVCFSNQDLMEDIGNEMLENSYTGFNSTVFAYGQTGAGKSYSIEGAPGDPGLLQKMCEAIFQKKGEVEQANSENQMKITVSYLEIYNEKLKDLLDSKDKDLKIYATKKQGIFVKNLEKVYCSSFEEVEKLLSAGKKMRVVGSTQMNKQSSRSHAVFTIYMSLKEIEDGDKKKVKNSEIHIVDLAGSERQTKTKATGDRLKEGSNINKSLTYLGIVIEKLSSGGKASHVPFRNSQLTYLLSESLGGNSKTTMIAAISPAAFNWEETTSTLMFAQRVASIQTSTKANVEEEANQKAALLREIAALKQELEDLDKQGKRGSKTPSELEAELQAAEAHMKDDNLTKKEQEEQSKKLEEERNKALEDAGLDAGELAGAFGADSDTPYMLNISDDPTLAGTLIFYLKDGGVKVGKEPGKGGIKVRGLGMKEHHATITNSGNESITIKVEPDCRVLVNGILVEDSIELKHNNRVVFGHGNAFRVMIPKKADEHTQEQKEAEQSGYGEIMNDRLQSDTPMTNNIKKYLKELEQRQDPVKAKQFAAMCAKILDSIDEANEFSKFRHSKFNRPDTNVYFTLEVMVDILDYEDDEPEFAVRCRNRDTDEVLFLWSYEKFLERLDLMADWYDDMQDDGILNRERYIDPWLDVSDNDVQINQSSKQMSDEDQIAKIKAKIQGLQKQQEALQKVANVFKHKVNEILQKERVNQDGDDSTMINKVKNREPEKVAEIKKELQELSVLVEIKQDIKQLRKELARLEGQKGERPAPAQSAQETAKDESIPIDERIEIMRKHNLNFEKEIKLLKKQIALKEGDISNADSQCCSIW